MVTVAILVVASSLLEEEGETFALASIIEAFAFKVILWDIDFASSFAAS